MISFNETCLTATVADLVVSEGLSFNFDQKPRFKKVLYLERNLSKGYNPPIIKLIFKDILDVIHDQNTQRKLIMIKKEVDIFLVVIYWIWCYNF